MGTTTNFALRYPEATSTVDVPRDVKALAEDVDRIARTNMPIGTIVLWYGSIATIPVGWKICDGTNGTPNLLGKFVIGASVDAGGTQSGTSYNKGATGGEEMHALSIAELAVHGHTGVALPTHDHGVNSSGAHDHYNWGRSDYARASSNQALCNSNAASAVQSTLGTDPNPSAHTHDIVAVSAGTPSVNSTGSGTAHENRPPFMALAYIMRTS